jgi:hypothetical protein
MGSAPDQPSGNAPFSTRPLAELEAEARYHRERYALYRARAYGMRPTSATKERELLRAAEAAEERLRLARARARGGGTSPT